MSSKITYSTPPAQMAKLGLAAFAMAILVMLFIGIVLQIDVKIIYLIVPFAICFLSLRHKVVLDADHVRLTAGLVTKDYPFADTEFHYGEITGAASWMQSVAPRTKVLHAQQQGGKLVKLPMFLSQTDFDTLIATMKERGARVEPL